MSKQGPSGDRGEWFDGRTNGLMISFTLLFCTLAIASETFLSGYTMFVLTRQLAFYLLIALAQAFCLVVGGMNLSVGAIGSIATVVLGLCLAHGQVPAVVAAGAALACGAASGLANGLLVTRLRIDSFVVTLSMMFVFMGLRSGISGGQPYAVPQSFTYLGQRTLLGLPWVFVIAVATLVLVWLLFRKTVFGRQLLATGGNLPAARLSGVKTDDMIVWANVISGLLAALAAVLWASQLGSAAPETGDNWLIISFAVAIIGGTGLAGGSISPVSLFLGGAIFMLIKHGLVEVKANPYYANAFLGLLILLAVILDRVRELYGLRRQEIH